MPDLSPNLEEAVSGALPTELTALIAREVGKRKD